MIWLRRVLTIPLGVLLLVFLLVALVLQQVGSTFLDPEYYPEELRQANIYEFGLVDVPTSFLIEARELDPADLPEELDENPLVTFGLSTERIVSSLNRALPPEWVQAQVEQAFDELGRYIAWERDTFEIKIDAGDQARTMVSEIKSLLSDADAYTLLFEEVIDSAIEDAVAEELPLGLDISGGRVVESVRRVVPPEWVRAQVEAALDEVTPYFTGERDTFEVRVELSDRVDIALDEVKDLLRETDAYDLLYDEVVEPQVKKILGDTVDLPLGLTVTIDEVLDALRQAAPPEWVQEQAEMVIAEAGPYLTGRADKLTAKVSLVDNKRAASAAIEEAVDAKLRRAVARLPECTGEAVFGAGLAVRSGKIPGCIPPNTDPEQVLDVLNVDIVGLMDRFILGSIPDNISFTDTELRQALDLAGGSENVELLDDLRELVADGWTYTDEDLRRNIRDAFDDPNDADEALGRLDDVRDFFDDDFTYTEIDLREDILRLGDQSDLEDFDDGRKYLGWARTYRLLVYLPVVLVLVAVGFLGGRRWRTRLAWAAAFLAVSSAIILVASGPLYAVFGESALEDAREEAFEQARFSDSFGNSERLLLDKAFDVLDSVVDGFASGIAFKSLILLLIGLVALGVSLALAYAKGSDRRDGPSADHWPADENGAPGGFDHAWRDVPQRPPEAL